MFQKLKKILGIDPGVDLRQLVRNGAQIIDVRSWDEFSGGHIKGSVNIPLTEIIGSMNKISRNKPVVVCCASGMRSASAKSLLRQKGYDVYNGGGWQSLERKIS